MGGVPFKSTGCNTCRRRKVKCDETKPECLRCVKNGHVCTGYERNRVFIHKSSDTMEDNPQKPIQRSKAVAYNSGARRPTQLEPEIPRLNVNTEVRSQLLQSFIDWYSPPSQYLAGDSKRHILEILPDLSRGSQLLDKAITSLSSAFLAKQNKDDHLLQYSTRLYGNAIRMLHGQINSGNILGMDVLYTTVIFQIYELINCSPPGFMAWIAHVQGSNAVIGQCAERKDESIAEQLFHRQLKYVTLCDAIGKRKAPAFLSSPAWQTGSSQGTGKSEPIDELIDKLAECTVLMERVDHYVQCNGHGIIHNRQTGEQLLSSCLSLERRLHETCISMQRKLGGPSTLPPNTPILQGFRSSLFTDIFSDHLQFPSLTCAEAHQTYWTTLVLLYPLIDQLLGILGQPGDAYTLAKSYSPSSDQTDCGTTPDSESAADFTALTEHYADEVCRTVLYCIQPEMKTMGAQMMLAPLSQAAQFYNVQEIIPKHQWCQSVFMASSHLGLGIGPLLKDMVWPKYRISQRQKSSSSGVESPETGS
ncbi:hypothetical protein P170DRAFT_448500 [Aspergillus steynii IBT 23096]|uniref:Zn(2)-C6 fungal-type domain-containing protein n=1 Tax=Aspergillus steynii IBT 23096 TaxID=1392250 RepID=A0A2I2G1G0_9EURO|nr:uncharacterized protein P170DRAFT_448500 [Aspergillus steynii IBT 23096]PLB46710.1 hypothetical protein P170DRAFT_448500 [Aspergillus steynii IBT 23096]